MQRPPKGYQNRRFFVGERCHVQLGEICTYTCMFLTEIYCSYLDRSILTEASRSLSIDSHLPPPHLFPMASQTLPSRFFFPVLLSLSILLPIVFSSTTSCSRGKIFESGSCKPCPPGTYQPFESSIPYPNRCEKCPAGTFNPHFGAVAVALCRPCYPGTATNTPGSTSCTPCPSGTVGKRGAKQCLACGPGSQYSDFNYKKQDNPSVCERCRKNYFSTGVANLECKQCPIGFTTPDEGAVSSDACMLCPAGKDTRPGGKGCEKCSSGKFKPTSAPGSCLSCPPGFISKLGRNLKCRSCKVGYFNHIINCLPCDEGFTTAKRGATRCRKLDYPCEPGTFENSRGDCERCEFGYRVNKITRVCEKCPENMISPGGTRTECTPCPKGQIDDGERIACRCPVDGEIANVDGVCVKCPAGTYMNIDQVGYESPTKCRKCPPGTFSEKGSGNCTPCPPGTVSKLASTRCRRCPEGMMPNIATSLGEEAVRCVSVRTGCPLGWKRQEPYSRSPIDRCRRVICTVGTKPEDIGRKCVTCKEGERLDDSGKRCKRCNSRSISLGGFATSCTPCPDGKFRTFSSPPTCNCRQLGYGMRGGMCKPCLPGTYSDLGAELCRKCPPGTYSDSKKTDSCYDCDFGTIAATEGATSCKPCPPGMKPNQVIAATRCVPTSSSLV